MREVARALALGILSTAIIASPAHAAPKFLLQSKPSGFGPAPLGLVNSSEIGTQSVAVCPSGADSSTCDPSGRFVAFTSAADGLSNQDNDSVQNVYLRDRVTNQTFLVSRSNGASGAPANDASEEPAVAILPGYIFGAIGDPPHVLVAFGTEATNLAVSDSGLIPGSDLAVTDTNHASDVYVRDVISVGASSDTITGVTALASNSGGTATASTGNSFSQDPAIGISDSHPIVAFDSGATDLAPGADNGAEQILIRDFLNNTTRLASEKKTTTTQQGDRSSFRPALSGNGHTLGFLSDAQLFGISSPPQAVTIDLASGAVDPTTTDVVSVSSSGQQGTRGVFGLALDGNGLRVVFDSFSQLDPGDSDQNEDVYLRNRNTNTTTLISTPASGSGIARDNSSSSSDPSIDTAGDRVGFISTAQLDGSDNHQGADAYVHDLATGVNSVVSRLQNQAADADSSGAAVSADGSRMVFQTAAGNLDPGGDAEFLRILEADLASHTQTPISRPSGTPISAFADGLDQSYEPNTGSVGTVSADGRFVLFHSQSTDLVPGTPPHTFNIFVRDNVTGSVRMVNRGTGANGPIAAPTAQAVISPDGSRVAFVSKDPVLGGPTNQLEVFIRNLKTNTTTLVSRSDGPGDAPASTGAKDPSLDGDGNIVAFSSSASLTSVPSGSHFQIYTRNLPTNQTTLVTQNGGAAGNANAVTPSLDATGNRVAFVTAATNLVPTPFPAGASEVLTRDLPSGGFAVASRATGASGAAGDHMSDLPQLDSAGDRAVFLSTATNLTSDTSTKAKVVVRDVAHATTILASRASGPDGAPADQGVGGAASISGDGQHVAFTSFSQNLGSIPSPAGGLFIRDLATTQTRLIAGGVSPLLSAPSLNADGRCAAFASAAPNLLGGPSLGTDFLRVYEFAQTGSCPNTAPQTAISKGPTAFTNKTRPSFSFTSTAGGSSFACSVDAQPFVPCHSPYRTIALGDGPHTFSVRATDASGNADPTPATRTFIVDTRAPVASSLSLKPRTFAVGSKKTATSAKRHHRGTKIHYRLSEPSVAKLTIKRCTRHKHKLQCKAAGTLTRHSRKGANTIAFSGRIGRHALAPGHYELVLLPTDLAGNRGRARTARFTIVRG